VNCPTVQQSDCQREGVHSGEGGHPYGDGVSDVDNCSLVECHKSSGKIATVPPIWRFGMLELVADGALIAYRHNGFFYALNNYREFRRLNDLWSGGAVP
jgi:hypothetical protein